MCFSEDTCISAYSCKCQSERFWSFFACRGVFTLRITVGPPTGPGPTESYMDRPKSISAKLLLSPIQYSLLGSLVSVLVNQPIEKCSVCPVSKFSSQPVACSGCLDCHPPCTVLQRSHLPSGEVSKLLAPVDCSSNCFVKEKDEARCRCAGLLLRITRSKEVHSVVETGRWSGQIASCTAGNGRYE